MPGSDNNGSCKKVLVIRLGAYGDMVFITPVFKALKADGYHVTLYVSSRGKAVIEHNPNIDRIIVHDENISIDALKDHVANMVKGYDKVVNLSESIEGTLLKHPGREDYYWPKEKRHESCNVNYYDDALMRAGYNSNGKNGELFFSIFEEKRAKDFRNKYRDKFLILWSLSGSSYHKVYPYTEYVAKAFLEKHPDSMIVTVGEPLCEVLEWSHPRTNCYSGKWPIRKSMLMTKYADLVIGTETGVLVAAGCYDTPKIILMSHSTEENWTKYYRNCQTLSANVHCQPCHQLHYDIDSCPTDKGLRSPICMAQLKAGDVYKAIETVYKDWRVKKHGRTHSANVNHAYDRRLKEGRV